MGTPIGGAVNNVLPLQNVAANGIDKDGLFGDRAAAATLFILQHDFSRGFAHADRLRSRPSYPPPTLPYLDFRAAVTGSCSGKLRYHNRVGKRHALQNNRQSTRRLEFELRNLKSPTRTRQRARLREKRLPSRCSSRFLTEQVVLRSWRTHSMRLFFPTSYAVRIDRADRNSPEPSVVAACIASYWWRRFGRG